MAMTTAALPAASLTLSRPRFGAGARRGAVCRYAYSHSPVL